MVDLHLHGRGFVPQPARSLWRVVNPRRPPEIGFHALADAGVDIAVANAVGDPIVTRWYRGASAAGAVTIQLAAIVEQAGAAGVDVVTSVDEATLAGRPAVLLGVEGADPAGRDLDLLDRWHGEGVRLVVLVHLVDNAFGTTCLPWQHYRLPMPVRSRPTRATGLTPLGRAAVSRLNDLGVVVDLAHADRATLLGAIEVSRAPIVSSHTGARALEDFPRYLADDELRAVAATGGLVGLWPYRGRRWGARTLDDLVAHARHVADVVGVEHLAIGTDRNGVPREPRGYEGTAGLPVLVEALRSAGFVEDEVTAIAGGNAVRVLRAVAAAAR